MNRAQKIIIFLFVLLVASLGAAGYFYYEAQQIPLDEPEAVVETTLESVARHLVLPEDEEPTIATVTNLDDLAGQPFFANAKVGDRVLIYTKARKAILYDPIADRLIEVAPLAIDAPQPATTTTNP